MYRHTQSGWTILVVLTAVLLLAAGVAIFLGSNTQPVPPPVFFIIPALLLPIMLLFSSLTVTVTHQAIEIHFGPGLIRKKFSLADIQSCEPVRNHWFFGWGIRWIPRGWLFNVSGLDAVELKMKNGRRYRIGTDEPERLCNAIQSKLPRDT
jgi:hypothetical protein